MSNLPDFTVGTVYRHAGDNSPWLACEVPTGPHSHRVILFCLSQDIRKGRPYNMDNPHIDEHFPDRGQLNNVFELPTQAPAPATVEEVIAMHAVDLRPGGTSEDRAWILRMAQLEEELGPIVPDGAQGKPPGMLKAIRERRAQAVLHAQGDPFNLSSDPEMLEVLALTKWKRYLELGAPALQQEYLDFVGTIAPKIGEDRAKELRSRVIPTRPAEGAPIVTVVAYRSVLVITGPADPTYTHPDWIPPSEGTLGCALRDSGANLGVSAEAMALLNSVERSPDDIGDVDWWDAQGWWVFSWLGGPLALRRPPAAKGSRRYEVGPCIEIPNDVALSARESVDQLLDAIK